MFSLHLTVLCLVIISVHSQGTDLNNVQTYNQGKGYPFGKLRVSQDGKTEEIIPATNNVVQPVNQDQPVSNVQPTVGNTQPLPSPCIGARPSTKLAYPKEKSKYILCRDEYHYEIFTCPNGGDYNEQTGACNYVAPVIDRCEQEKPCLYDGQCISLSNSTFKCVCRAEWTGERCEVPLNSCSTKPCGAGAECRYLKTTDFEQDYACICHSKRGYGLNCQETVPNPCLKSSEQFFPYAFSSHAYIQCDGELIHFQPCGSLLYWNQEEKICDRKRPTKIEMPTLITKLTKNNNNNNEYSQEKGTGTVNTEDSTTTTTSTTTLRPVIEQTGQNLPESVSNINSNQQGSLTQPMVGSQIRSDFMPKTQQWPSQETGTNSFVPKNTQTSYGKMNEQPATGQQNQGFGTQQWLNSVPSTNVQTNEKSPVQPESWRRFESNQISSPNIIRQPMTETATGNNPTGEGQSWQNRPAIQNTQPQTWQTTSQLTKNQQLPTMNLVDGRSSENSNRLNTQSGLGQNNPSFMGSTSNPKADNTQQFGTQTQPWSNSQTALNQPQTQDSQNANNQEQVPSWKQQQATQFNTNQLPQTTRFDNSQQQQQQPWQRMDSRFGQTNQQPIVDTSATGSNTIRPQESQNTNTQEKLQPWQMKSAGITTENQPSQTSDSSAFPSRSMNDQQPQQAWRRFESPSTQGQEQNFNQQPAVDTTKTGANRFAGQTLRTILTPQSVQNWQTKSSNSLAGTQQETTQTNEQPQQAWRRFESPPVQSQTQNFNAPRLTEPTDFVRNQGSQNLNRQEPSKPWQTNTFRARTPEQPWQQVDTPTNEQNSQNKNSEVRSSQMNPVLAFQPKSWTNSKPTQQENLQTSQNTNNAQSGVPTVNSFAQNSWTPNQQFLTQGGQPLATSNDMTSNQNFGTRSVQPSVNQGLQNWQTNQASLGQQKF